MNELDRITNESHDHEADSDSLGYLHELFAIGFRAAQYEILAILKEIALTFEELLDLFRHDCWIYELVNE